MDNAGLWKEYQLSTIDRSWILEGAPKKKEYIPNTEIAMDEDGILIQVERERSNEFKGLKLILLTFELESLLGFESYVSNAKHNEHKLISAYYRYRDCEKRRQETFNRRI